MEPQRLSSHPSRRDRLVASKWSRASAECALRHFEVRAVRSDGTVELFSVLDPRVVERLPWRALRDRTQWLPGWV